MPEIDGLSQLVALHRPEHMLQLIRNAETSEYVVQITDFAGGMPVVCASSWSRTELVALRDALVRELADGHALPD
jgi:hypothetical protein